MGTTAACITILVVSTFGQAAPKTFEEILKLPGYDAVAAMKLEDYTVTTIRKGAGTMELTGPKNDKITVYFDPVDERADMPLFDEADVTEKPLKLQLSGMFRVGQKVKASKMAIMRPLVLDDREARKLKDPSIGKEPPMDDEKPIGDKVPVIAQVDDVIIVDTKSKRAAFDKLPPSVQREMLIVAGNVIKLKDVRPIGTVKLTPQQKAMMNMDKVNIWLERHEKDLAVAGGINELFKNASIPDEAQRDAMRRFNEMSRERQRALIALSRKAKARGFDSLTEEQKRFAKEHQMFFGSDKPKE